MIFLRNKRPRNDSCGFRMCVSACEIRITAHLRPTHCRLKLSAEMRWPEIENRDFRCLYNIKEHIKLRFSASGMQMRNAGLAGKDSRLSCL